MAAVASKQLPGEAGPRDIIYVDLLQPIRERTDLRVESQEDSLTESPVKVNVTRYYILLIILLWLDLCNPLMTVTVHFTPVGSM